ncbi:MAG: beta-hydroxyacyl-ACP dehydratase [Planctomycetales bacterium]|nr:beta-hydroxyacyl-ACP dehydratase [Planctomycetales bacterium]
MRYFLIDKVTSLDVGQSVTGLKCVTLSDQVLHDHFPDFPTMPGALIIEAASQLSGFLIEMSANRNGDPIRRSLLAQIDLAKFHRRVGPGETMEIVARIEQLRDPSVQVVAEVGVAGQTVARARLTFMLQAVDSERVHRQRRYLYELWTRDLELSTPIL